MHVCAQDSLGDRLAGCLGRRLALRFSGLACQHIECLGQVLRQPFAAKRFKRVLATLNYRIEHGNDALILRRAGIHHAERMENAGLACPVFVFSQGPSRNLHSTPQGDRWCCPHDRPGPCGRRGAMESCDRTFPQPICEATKTAAGASHIALMFAQQGL